MKACRRPLVLSLLLVVGVAGWVLVGQGWHGRNGVSVAVVACFAVACIPQLRSRLNGLTRGLRHPVPRTRGRVAVGVALAMAPFLYYVAIAQQRGLYPKYHDHFMYLLQARMLAAGRLWMPPHPLSDFFDTFYVFVEPVYASLCWPGASLLFVPSVWLGLPPWIAPLAAASVAAGLLYSVVTQMFDGLCGLLATLGLAAIPVYRVQALYAQAQAPMLMLALLLIWSWLRWRRRPRLARAALVGAVAGWAAITRPVDAICVIVPIALCTLPLLRRLPMRLTIRHASVAAACAMPFVALQLAFNVGVTGSVMRTPFTYYNERDQPQLAFGFPEYDPDMRPQSRLLQKHVLYDEWVAPRVRTHTLGAAPAQLLTAAKLTMNLLLPHRLLWVLVPAALLGIFSTARIAIWGVLPLFLVLYGFYTLFLDHYTLLAAPAVLTIMLGGMRAVQRCWPGISGATAVGVAALSVGSLPLFQPHARDETPTPTMDYISKLPRFIESPAVVLFRFKPWLNVHEEPVYNVDVAWPDDATIVRAHDLGPLRNVEIVRYYAARQPHRHFYIFDRSAHGNPLHYLGTAAELWRKVQRSDTGRASTTRTTAEEKAPLN